MGKKARGDGRAQEAVDKLKEQQMELAAGLVRGDGARARLEEVMRNLAEVGPRHDAPSFAGDILLFIASRDRPPHMPVDWAIASWQPLTSGTVEPHEIPVDHNQMMQPASLAQIGAIVAEKLRPRP